MKTATKDSMKQVGTLTQRPQFLRVQSTGQKWVSNSVIVMVAHAEAAAETVRFGLTVTKKLNKSAVVRNDKACFFSYRIVSKMHSACGGFCAERA